MSQYSEDDTLMSQVEDTRMDSDIEATQMDDMTVIEASSEMLSKRAGAPLDEPPAKRKKGKTAKKEKKGSKEKKGGKEKKEKKAKRARKVVEEEAGEEDVGFEEGGEEDVGVEDAGEAGDEEEDIGADIGAGILAGGNATLDVDEELADDKPSGVSKMDILQAKLSEDVTIQSFASLIERMESRECEALGGEELVPDCSIACLLRAKALRKQLSEHRIRICIDLTGEVTLGTANIATHMHSYRQRTTVVTGAKGHAALPLGDKTDRIAFDVLDTPSLVADVRRLVSPETQDICIQVCSTPGGYRIHFSADEWSCDAACQYMEGMQLVSAGQALDDVRESAPEGTSVIVRNGDEEDLEGTCPEDGDWALVTDGWTEVWPDMLDWHGETVKFDMNIACPDVHGMCKWLSGVVKSKGGFEAGGDNHVNVCIRSAGIRAHKDAVIKSMNYDPKEMEIPLTELQATIEDEDTSPGDKARAQRILREKTKVLHNTARFDLVVLEQPLGNGAGESVAMARRKVFGNTYGGAGRLHGALSYAPMWGILMDIEAVGDSHPDAHLFADVYKWNGTFKAKALNAYLDTMGDGTILAVDEGEDDRMLTLMNKSVDHGSVTLLTAPSMIDPEA